MPIKKKAASAPRSVTLSDVKETSDQLIREAFREHSRQLEQHLKDIDARLRALEGRR